MSGESETKPQDETTPTVAETLGVDEHDAETILELHGYRDDAAVTEITEEEYQDLMQRPPLDANKPGT